MRIDYSTPIETISSFLPFPHPLLPVLTPHEELRVQNKEVSLPLEPAGSIALILVSLSID